MQAMEIKGEKGGILASMGIASSENRIPIQELKWKGGNIQEMKFPFKKGNASSGNEASIQEIKGEFKK